MKKLRTLVSGLTLLAITSCSSIGYRAITIAPCLPEEDKTLDKEIIAKRDSSYFNQRELLEYKDNNDYKKGHDIDEVRFKFNIWDFD